MYFAGSIVRVNNYLFNRGGNPKQINNPKQYLHKPTTTYNKENMENEWSAKRVILTKWALIVLFQ